MIKNKKLVLENAGNLSPTVHFCIKKNKTQNFPKYIILQQEREEVKLHERENNLK